MSWVSWNFFGFQVWAYRCTPIQSIQLLQRFSAVSLARIYFQKSNFHEMLLAKTFEISYNSAMELVAEVS